MGVAVVEFEHAVHGLAFAVHTRWPNLTEIDAKK